MVLDQLDDKCLALRIALKNNRVVVARDILIEIYSTEHALQVRIREFDQSDWGKRLRHLMDTIAAMVDAEVDRFPDEVGHILTSRSLRRHHSLAGPTEPSGLESTRSGHRRRRRLQEVDRPELNGAKPGWSRG